MAPVPVKLIIAGEFYENPEPYLQLIHRLKLEPLFELRTLFIADKDVSNYFALADLEAQPYRSATQSGVSQIAYHYENRCWLPMWEPCRISASQQGWLCGGCNVKKIADALVDFYANGRSGEFINNIREEKKKYAWSKMTATLNSI